MLQDIIASQTALFEDGVQTVLRGHENRSRRVVLLKGNLVQNMTLHKWFANKACPGAYLEERMFDIAAKVNALL